MELLYWKCDKAKKIKNVCIPRKRMDRQTKGRVDRLTLFHRTLPAAAVSDVSRGI